MKKNSKTVVDKLTEGFTREVPEHCTLLELAVRRPVKAFEVEHIKTGMRVIFAHFDLDGVHHLYHDGDGAISKHLFFWVCSWEHDKSPEDMSLEMFGNKFILAGEA